MATSHGRGRTDSPDTIYSVRGRAHMREGGGVLWPVGLGHYMDEEKHMTYENEFSNLSILQPLRIVTPLPSPIEPFTSPSVPLGNINKMQLVWSPLLFRVDCADRG